jgi:mono/diheme cytochrome c family protein
MPEHHKRHVFMLLLGAAGFAVAGGAIGVAVLLSGVLNTAATKQHLALTHRVLDAGLSYSVRHYSEDVVAPPLDDPGMQARGAACYQQHCAACHGAPGVPPGAAALGMMPVPTNLTSVARGESAEWLYYVTRKGVRMTGMPAWEFRLSEESLWSTVAFLRTLPALDAAAYRARLDEAAPLACPARTNLPEPLGDGADANEGEVLLRQYACHSCHTIEGVVGPRIDVGPPLVDWAQRGYIAGVLANTPENLARWIADPQEISPKTLMPDLDVPPAHARAMTAFLFAQQ